MATIDYGTQRFIRNSGAPRPVGQLAASMNNTGARVGELNPGLVVPGGNVQAQNVGQPMRRLDYGAPLAAPPPNPGNLPPSSTTTQTGQGGGQSQIVGASEGQQGQAQGVGRQPGTSATMPVYTGSVHPADPGTAHRAPGTSSTMPVNTSTSRPQRRCSGSPTSGSTPRPA